MRLQTHGTPRGRKACSWSSLHAVGLTLGPAGSGPWWAQGNLLIANPDGLLSQRTDRGSEVEPRDLDF